MKELSMYQMEEIIGGSCNRTIAQSVGLKIAGLAAVAIIVAGGPITLGASIALGSAASGASMLSIGRIYNACKE